MANQANTIRLYDGKRFCGECSCGCPVADYDRATGMVTITDPDKPQSGTFTMTGEEFNALIENAKPVD